MTRRFGRTASLVLAATCAAGALSAVPMSVAAPAAFAETSQAAEGDGCPVGVLNRIAGPPPAFTEIGWSPSTLIDAPTGAGVTVAVIDSGIDVTRPQLADAFAPGSASLIADGERSDGLGDPQGHGTALAGIIAARPSDASGVVGIAPGAKLISLRVFRDDDQASQDQGFDATPERVAQAIRAATDLGAQIISVSLSDDVDESAVREATTYASDRGSLVVGSAGNRGTTPNTEDSPRYPGAYPEAIAVTAVNAAGLPTSDSIHGDHVDVAAPGQNVLTLATGGGDCIYGEAPQSSYSTAYVAGAAALLAERYPDEGPAGWKYRLEATAARSNPDARDDQVGWGVIRPAAALDLRPSATTRGPVSPFADTSDAAFSSSPTRVTTHPAEAGNEAFVTAIAVVAGGLVALFGLGALLRRRRQSETAGD